MKQISIIKNTIFKQSKGEKFVYFLTTLLFNFGK